MLLLAAFIWGFAFVVQKTSMEHIGPFTYNGLRFALGSFSLLPLIYFLKKKPLSNSTAQLERSIGKLERQAGFRAGLILFVGSSLQQIGLIYTTAGKAAFITGLYIVIVPLLGLFLRHRLNLNMGLGAIVAAIGLYYLSVTEDFTISNGDLLELVGAVFWSIHILMIDRYSRKVDIFKLSYIQMVTCSILSLGVAVVAEHIAWSTISQVIIPILYGGILSAGVAYTLQIVGQKNALPSQAAIILSLEVVFAAIGGFLLLQEHLSMRGLMGCLLMLVGMLLPQLPRLRLFKASN